MEESVSRLLTAKKIRPPSYLMDLFKYLVHIALGSKDIIAYRPFGGNDNVFGPINDILKVILDVYGLEKYAPTMMLPHHFMSDKDCRPVYYSLQIPTYCDSMPKSRDSISVRKDLDNLIWLFDAFANEIKKGSVQISIPLLANLFERVSIDFFHTDGKDGEAVKPAHAMPLTDANLLYLPGKPNQYGKREFADRVSFVRACVKISKK